MKRLGLLVAGVGMSLAIMAGTASANTIIDTTASWDGSSNVIYFGGPNTATYGQTITAPSDNVLNSFTFYMNIPSANIFRGEVYAWDGSEASGPNLYESAPMSTSGPGTFEAITFNTGGIDLTAGSQYVLFASVSKDYLSSSGQGSWGYMGYGSSGPYPGGGFVFQNNGGDPSQWTSTPWSTSWGGDLAFKADFSPSAVPEPSTLLLLGSGMTGLGIYGRKFGGLFRKA